MKTKNDLRRRLRRDARHTPRPSRAKSEAGEARAKYSPVKLTVFNPQADEPKSQRDAGWATKRNDRRVARPRTFSAPVSAPVSARRFDAATMLSTTGSSPSTDDVYQAPLTRVLIAGADQDWLDDVSQWLCEYGYEAIPVRGGVDCIALLRASSFDVLVIDAQLPWGGANGVLEIVAAENIALHEVFVLSRGHDAPLPAMGDVRVSRIEKPLEAQTLAQHVMGDWFTCAY